MISSYFHAIASTYLGLPFLDFIAVGVLVLLVLVVVLLKRGGK